MLADGCLKLFVGKEGVEEMSPPRILVRSHVSPDSAADRRLRPTGTGRQDRGLEQLNIRAIKLLLPARPAGDSDSLHPQGATNPVFVRIEHALEHLLHANGKHLPTAQQRAGW